VKRTPEQRTAAARMAAAAADKLKLAALRRRFFQGFQQITGPVPGSPFAGQVI